MKILKFIITVLIILLVSNILAERVAYCDDKELIIKYKEFKGRPVDLVYNNKTGQVNLRILLNGPSFGEDELAFMKNEVEYFTSIKKEIGLGKSGYTIKFMGGYPIWAPYGEAQGIKKEWECLLFAKKAIIIEKHIYIWGEKEKDKYNYPYSSKAGSFLK